MVRSTNQPQPGEVHKFYARNEGKFFAVLYLVPLLGLLYLLFTSSGEVGLKNYIPIVLVTALFAFHCIPLFFIPYVTISPEVIKVKVPPGLSKVPVLPENITRLEEGLVYLLIYYRPSNIVKNTNGVQTEDRLVIKIHSIFPEEGQKMLQIVQKNQKKQ